MIAKAATCQAEFEASCHILHNVSLMLSMQQHCRAIISNCKAHEHDCLHLHCYRGAKGDCLPS